MRNSAVGNLVVINIQFSSMVQIGDCIAVMPGTEVLAVQRQTSLFWANEGNFDSFKTFRQKFPEIREEKPVSMTVTNELPDIQVGHVKILGLAVAGVVRAGSSKIVDAAAHTLHIRHLHQGKRPVGYPAQTTDGEEIQS